MQYLVNFLLIINGLLIVLASVSVISFDLLAVIPLIVLLGLPIMLLTKLNKKIVNICTKHAKNSGCFVGQDASTRRTISDAKVVDLNK